MEKTLHYYIQTQIFLVKQFDQFNKNILFFLNIFIYKIKAKL